jgi:hypothetical protein
LLIGRNGEISVLDRTSPAATDLSPVHPKAGSAKGQIKLAGDFDAPLADFSEYR